MSTHLGEVAHDVEAFAVVLRHDVEEEGVCVIVQRLVVKETLGQKTQVLGVTLRRKRPVTTLGSPPWGVAHWAGVDQEPLCSRLVDEEPFSLEADPFH